MKKFVIILIVVVAVLLTADFGLAAAAEYQVSKRMRAELGLAADPSVDIHGFPFITQAIAGDYSDISVNAIGVPARNTLRDLEVDADLRHVHVGLSDLLSGNVQQVRIDEVDGQVQIKASDVGRLLNIPDLTITPQSLDTILGVGADEAQQAREKQTGDDTSTVAGLELTGTVDIAGQRTTVSAYGLISLANGDITITPKKVELANSLVSGPLSSTIEQQLLPRFGVTLRPSELPLPFTVQPTGVQVGNGTLIVQGTAHNIVLNSGSSM